MFPRTTLQRVGFFATRWVEAATAQEAGDKADALVAEELRGLVANTAEQPWGVAVLEVRGDPDGFAERAPGRGFTFFDEDETDPPGQWRMAGDPT